MTDHLWYPYHAAKTAPAPLMVKSAAGAWLELADGRRLLDCISSWWVNTYGHGHPRIARGIYEQAQVLEQVIFSGFTHEPAEQLAEKLTGVLGSGLDRVFYSDNGSTAVEVALKMAYQYWVNRGQPRSTFLSFSGAYHGDTFGAMAVGARSIFSEVFGSLLFQVETVAYPDTWQGDLTVADREAMVLQEIEIVLAQGQCAGMILEPLVQGAGGMRMSRPEFLQALRRLADEYQTLLIFDEVMTGFGRTGGNFAFQVAGAAPDIICLSKGITGGFLPFAVTVCREKIYEAFYSEDPLHTLYHGHSYTANPLGCAAALVGLELLAEFRPSFETMADRHWQHLEKLQDHPLVHRTRVRGTIAALEIGGDRSQGYLNKVGMKVRELGLSQGLLLRPLGNVLYLLPPYCITPEELDFTYVGISKILADLLAER
jgi:adenosylmethionine---8-amino-7-oxononanoate aminotransferase